MRKSLSIFTFATGLLGLLFATLLALMQWRILSLDDQPSRDAFGLIDWHPYPELIAMALNWWIPLSLLICGAGACWATQDKRSSVPFIGCCFHTVSLIGLGSLGLWVFTGPLKFGADGVWWMRWIS